LEAKIYCKNHLKEATGTAKPLPSTMVSLTSTEAPSFVPSPTSEPEPEERKVEKKETSEKTAAKFKAFREEGDANKCSSCSKTVYAAERLVVEDKNEKRLYHKICFKCSVCQLALDLRNYGSKDGKIYCKNHLKEVTGTDKPVAATGMTSTGGGSSASFIPEVKDEKLTEKGTTPDHIAAKFKGIGSGGEKCKACQKTVYAAERIVVEELKQQTIFHKRCLKCTHCGIQLDLSTFGSAGGTIFCKVHLKQYGKPEQARSDAGIFISPLANKTEGYVPGARDEFGRSEVEGERKEGTEGGEDRPRSPSEGADDVPKDDERRDEGEPQPEHTDEERKDEGESQPEQREENNNEAEGRGADDSENQEDERKKKREERQRQREEEDKKFEEERRRRKEGREDGGSEASSEDRDEERRKRREEREREKQLEEEERERKERERKEKRGSKDLGSGSSDAPAPEEDEKERRKREREERRRLQDEEAKREAEEQKKKAEDRRKRLEALRSGDN
jgi:Pyruvate/2-oxoacid:ferredoxin oxidoreductase delta subunit